MPFGSYESLAQGAMGLENKKRQAANYSIPPQQVQTGQPSQQQNSDVNVSGGAGSHESSSWGGAGTEWGGGRQVGKGMMQNNNSGQPGSYLQFDTMGPDLYGGSAFIPGSGGNNSNVGLDSSGNINHTPTAQGTIDVAGLMPGTYDAQHGAAIESATQDELEAANNRDMHAWGQEAIDQGAGEGSDWSWIDDYLSGIEGAQHDWQSSVDQNAAMRDAALRHMYEQMGSRGMGASGASGTLAGDIYQNASRDLAGEWEALRQAKQEEMMGLGDLLWKDRWEQMDQAQKERMANWMFDHQKEMADFLEGIKQGRPGQIEDLLNQIMNSWGNLQ